MLNFLKKNLLTLSVVAVILSSFFSEAQNSQGPGKRESKMGEIKNPYIKKIAEDRRVIKSQIEAIKFEKLQLEKKISKIENLSKQEKLGLSSKSKELEVRLIELEEEKSILKKNYQKEIAKLREKDELNKIELAKKDAALEASKLELENITNFLREKESLFEVVLQQSNEEKKKMKLALDDRAKTIKSLQINLESLGLENNNTSRQLEETEKNLLLAQSQIKILQGKLEARLELDKSYQDQLSSNENVIEQKITDNENLKSELSIAKNNLEAAAKEKDQIDAKLQLANNKLEENYKSLAIKDTKIQELAESLDVQIVKLTKEKDQIDAKLQLANNKLEENYKSLAIKDTKIQELAESLDVQAIEFTKEREQLNFEKQQLQVKNNFLNKSIDYFKGKIGNIQKRVLSLQEESLNKDERINDLKNKLQTQQSEKNQAIAQLESELNQVQARGDKMLSKNDKAWLTQFIEKQQTRYNDWQSTKKSILTEVVKKGLLHDLRDPLEDLLIEEDFITLQEQRQLLTWGINIPNSFENTNEKAVSQDAEYAYTSIYSKEMMAESRQPSLAVDILNNEIQGSFRFNPQGTRAKSTPNLSEEEQEKRDFLSYYKQGLTQQAIEKGEQILERAPSNNGMLYNLSLLHIKRQEFDAAKTYSKKLIDLSEQNHQGHYLKGLIAYYEQDIEAAKSALGKAVTLNPQFAPAWLYFGHLLNYSNQYTEAKQAFEKVIEYQGESASVYYNLAVLSKKVNKPKEGVYYYQKSLDLGGKIDVELANDLLLAAQ